MAKNGANGNGHDTNVTLQDHRCIFCNRIHWMGLDPSQSDHPRSMSIAHWCRLMNKQANARKNLPIHNPQPRNAPP